MSLPQYFVREREDDLVAPRLVDPLHLHAETVEVEEVRARARSRRALERLLGRAQLLRRVHGQPHSLVAVRQQTARLQQSRERGRLVVASLGQALERLLARGRRCRRSPSAAGAAPRGTPRPCRPRPARRRRRADGSGATTIVAAAPCSRWCASSAPKSTSSDLVAVQREHGPPGPSAWRREADAAAASRAARARRPRRPRRRSPRARARRPPPARPCTRRPRARRRPTRGARASYETSGRPPPARAASGVPAPASPSRSAFPPARTIASIRRRDGDRLALVRLGDGAERRRRAPDALVDEAGGAGRLRVEQVPAVHDERVAHRLADLGPRQVARARPTR